jgi:uncharacterized membrane protein
MSTLIVIVYPTEAKAEEVRQTLLGLQKEYIIKVGDAVIATKTEAGKVKLNQLLNTTATGAVSGSFWGLLIGVLFLNPLIGVAMEMTEDKVLKQIQGFGGVVLKTSLDETKEQVLRDALQKHSAAAGSVTPA